MIKRLFDQLNRQLLKVEDLKKDENEPDDPQTRAINARTLASLERSLERLTQLEQRRLAVQSTKVSPSNENQRAALERELHQLVAAERSGEVSGETE